MRNLYRRAGEDQSGWPLLLACCILFLYFAPSATLAQSSADATTAERRIKAAFLYKFASYVEWPESAFPQADTPITVAIDGDDPLADELAQIVAGRTVAGRTLVVRKQKPSAPPSGAHMLFSHDVHENNPPIDGTQALPTLIVTDSPGALARGSTINFMIVDEHVRFEVSLEDAEQRGLKLSARLLAVAQNLRAGKP